MTCYGSLWLQSSDGWDWSHLKDSSSPYLEPGLLRQVTKGFLVPWRSLSQLTGAQFFTWWLKVFRAETGKSFRVFPNLALKSLPPHLVCQGSHKDSPRTKGKEQKFNFLLEEHQIICGYVLKLGFPGSASGEEPTCQCMRHKRHRFNSWVGKIS